MADFYTMRVRHVYLGMAGIGLLLLVLVIIQVGWLSKVRSMERKDAAVRINRALDKTAKDLEENVNCFEAYSKSFINAGEPLYLLHNVVDSLQRTSRVDTMPIVYNPTGFFPDTAIIIDKMARFRFPVLAEVQVSFHRPFNDSALRRLQEYAVMDTAHPRTYRDLVMNRVDVTALFNAARVDSVLKANLVAEHLEEARFGYGFISINGTTEFASRIDDTAVLIASPHKVILFQNDRFFSPHKLAVVFTGLPGGYGFAWWLLLSLTIILLLSLGFFLFVRQYMRQRRLSEMKSDFINNLTHEFNTPMANIALAIETMNGNGTHDAKTNHILNIISSESYRLRENIERTLQVATLEQGRMEILREPVDLVALINTVLTGYQSRCEQLGGSIRFLHDGDVRIYGDEVHLLNCLCNLLDNAIKYSIDAPKIVITLRSASQEVLLQISDNGIGMSAETQKHIFEQFYRAHQGNLHNTKGFGLGLNYVRGIVSLHGGRISVRSKVGEGSTFIIHLPKSLYATN